MDIAYYLSELLGELGEVNVPGLGNFKQLKINGYYNDGEGKFYPPANDVRFSSNFADDDVLAEYIAEKKKISLASSKYFTEKYVNNLKQDAIHKDVPLADLGWMRFSVHEISFKSAGASSGGPAFFGYPQIELKTLGNTSFLHQLEALMQVHKDEIIPVPVLAEEPPKEPELPVIHQEEPGTLLAEEPVKEIELPAAQHNEAMPVVAEEPAKEPEQPLAQQEELPAADLPDEHTEEPKLPLAQAEETSAHETAHEEPPAETEITEIHHEEIPVVLPYEPVKEPEPSEFDLEAYLRELEAAAGIATPQPGTLQDETETIIPEQAINETETKAEADIPAPEALPVQEIKPPEPVMDVPLPEPADETFDPQPELQNHIPASAPSDPQPEVYTLPVTPNIVASLPAEEDFVFDGKGYDDVDNSRRGEKSYAWLWITLLIIVLLAGAGWYVWYRHQQSVLKMVKANVAPVPLKVPVQADTAKTTTADSLKDSTQSSVIKDTTQKAVSAPIAGTIDSTKTRYELVSVSVPTIAAANRCVVNYKSLGVADAHVLIPGPGMGRLIKVSLGTFNARLDAIHRKKELLKTGNIREITILKINPKK